MSLSTQGKEALRNARGQLACVSVRVRVKKGQLLNLAATPGQFTVGCARGLLPHSKDTLPPSSDGRDSRQLEPDWISRQTLVLVTWLGQLWGGQELLLGFKKRKL